MKYLSKHEILNHGPEGEQYFQGCGTSGTEFAYVVTGVGDTFRLALEDALEEFASNSEGAPFSTMERLVKEYAAGCAKAQLDRSVHAAHEKVCGECDVVVKLNTEGAWTHQDGGAPLCDGATPVDACEECDVHHYVSLRWSVEDVVLRLDNMDHDDGMVLVLTPQGPEYEEAAEDDQTLEGSTWEDSGDDSPYNLITDRVGLVEDLRKEGYVLDLSEYVPPEEHEVPCAGEKSHTVMLADAHWDDQLGGLVCGQCADHASGDDATKPGEAT